MLARIDSGAGLPANGLSFIDKTQHRKKTHIAINSLPAYVPKGSMPPREFRHQPVVFFPNRGSRALLATPVSRMGEGSVLQTNGNISPVKIHPEVSRDYGAALQDAAGSSVTSM